MSVIYSTKATVKGGRAGTATLSDHSATFDLGMPAAKDNGAAVNPEQLFAMGYAGCFGGALGLVAKNAGQDLDAVVHVTINLHKADAADFRLSGKIEVEASGADQATLDDLVQKAHAVCPYSKATRGNVDIELVARAI